MTTFPRQPRCAPPSAHAFTTLRRGGGAAALPACLTALVLFGCDSRDPQARKPPVFQYESECSASYRPSKPPIPGQSEADAGDAAVPASEEASDAGDLQDAGLALDASVDNDAAVRPSNASDDNAAPQDAGAAASEVDAGADECTLTHQLIDQFASPELCEWADECGSPIPDCYENWWTPAEVQQVVAGLNDNAQAFCLAATILIDDCTAELSCSELDCFNSLDCTSTACADEVAMYADACSLLAYMLEENRWAVVQGN